MGKLGVMVVSGLILGSVAACDGAPSRSPTPTAAQPPAASPPPAAAAPPQPPPVAQPLVDVPALVGKDEGEVEAILGAPASCETVSPSGVGKSRKCNYRSGNVEVVYIGGKADWLTVYGSDAPSKEVPALDGKVGPAVLGRLGLKGSNPVKGPLSTVYQGTVDGLLEVTLFKVNVSDDTLSYVYIKAKTP